MNPYPHQRSVAPAIRGWLRGHTLLVAFGVFTALALTVAVAQSVLAGNVFPLVFFLILGAVIMRGVLRLSTGTQRDEGGHPRR